MTPEAFWWASRPGFDSPEYVACTNKSARRRFLYLHKEWKAVDPLDVPKQIKRKAWHAPVLWEYLGCGNEVIGEVRGWNSLDAQSADD